MGAFEHKVGGICDKSAFCTGVGTPQQKHHWFLSVVEVAYYAVGYCFPTLTFVGVGLTCAYCQNSIEKQYALFGPFFQTAVVGNGQSEIVLDLFEYVLQRGRWGNALSDAEGQSVSLIGTVIGILPDYNDLDR